MDKKILIKKSSFIIKSKEIQDNYIIGDMIGKGSTGVIRRLIDKTTNQVRAVKMIPLKRINKINLFEKDIEIIRGLDHPNIIKMYEYYQDEKYFYIVMEYCNGGELLLKVGDLGQITEDMAKTYFIQMISAVNYIHSKGLFLKNLRPEKFMFNSVSPNSTIKLLNLSFSMILQTPTLGNLVRLKPLLTTDYFEAPEIFSGKYDKSCDIWSCGIILYVLLCGTLPFEGISYKELNQKLIDGNIKLIESDFEGISNEAKELIYLMLNAPEKRLTASQILENKWLKSSCEISLNVKLDCSKLVKQIKAFNTCKRLHKTILTNIATQCNEAEVAQITKTFLAIDTNHDGHLSYEEICKAFEGSMTKEELLSLMDSLDVDKSGQIDFTEFLASTLDSNIFLSEERLIKAFNSFDKDKSGKISAQEIKNFISSDCSENDEKLIEDIINEADLDGDGQIDLNEFMKMMNNFNDLERKIALIQK